MQLAIGHIPGTALPGQAGNVGVAGHRDTFFRELKDLKNRGRDSIFNVEWRFPVRRRIAHHRRAGQCRGARRVIRQRADAGDLLSLFLYRGRAQAVRRKGQAGAANGAIVNCGMMRKERPAMAGRLGVSLKHASVVRAARILVIEDNGSDVFLLDRALKKQDLRFELVHLLSGGEALAFIRRQGAYADAADSRPDPGGLEPVQVYRRRHLARDPKRQAPRRRSGVRVEFFPVPARRGSAQGPREFPNSSPSLPVWINSWRSAKPSRICWQVQAPADDAGRRRGGAAIQRHSTCSNSPAARKVMVARGKEDRQSPARRGRAFCACREVPFPRQPPRSQPLRNVPKALLSALLA